MDKIRVVVKEPHEAAREIEIENTEERLERALGGPVDSIWFAKNVWMLINKEGKDRDFPFNFYLWDDVVVGTAIFVGSDGDELDDCPVSAQAIDRIIRKGDENENE